MLRDLSNGWQMIFADLSIILFMMTASAVGHPLTQPAKPITKAGLADDNVPVAIWSDGPGAEPLQPWMKREGADPRIGFTFIVRYPEGALQTATATALSLAQEAGGQVRIVLEPSNSRETLVVARFAGTAVSRTKSDEGRKNP